MKKSLEEQIRNGIEKFGNHDFSLTIQFGEGGNAYGREEEISPESGRHPDGERADTVQSGADPHA